jgi:hypothetical protein
VRTARHAVSAVVGATAFVTHAAVATAAVASAAVASAAVASAAVASAAVASAAVASAAVATAAVASAAVASAAVASAVRHVAALCRADDVRVVATLSVGACCRARTRASSWRHTRRPTRRRAAPRSLGSLGWSTANPALARPRAWTVYLLATADGNKPARRCGVAETSQRCAVRRGS